MPSAALPKKARKDKSISIGKYDFGSRIYDNRVCRWLSTDPMPEKYSVHSPNNFVVNNPYGLLTLTEKTFLLSSVGHTKRRNRNTRKVSINYKNVYR